jgi:hypothetical protein
MQGHEPGKKLDLATIGGMPGSVAAPRLERQMAVAAIVIDGRVADVTLFVGGVAHHLLASPKTIEAHP